MISKKSDFRPKLALGLSFSAVVRRPKIQYSYINLRKTSVIIMVSFSSFWKRVVLSQALKKMDNATHYANKNQWRPNWR